MNKFFRREEIAERAKKAVLIGITLLILVSIMTVSTACFFDFGDYEDDGKRYQIGEAAVTGSTQVTVNKVFQTKKIGSYSTNYYFVTLEVQLKIWGPKRKYMFHRTLNYATAHSHMSRTIRAEVLMADSGCRCHLDPD